MEENCEEQEVREGPGILHYLFSALFKWKWLVLGVTVGVALIVFIAFQFIINPGKVSYQYSFYVYYPNSSSGTFPDGTPFEYKDMISADNLATAKASDEKFKDVDIEKIREKGDITVVRTYEAVKIEGMEESKDEETSDIATVLTYYTFTIKASYFDNAQDATAFMQALAQYPLTYSLQVVDQLNYTVYLNNYSAETNLTYSELLNALVAQSDFILGKYDALITCYGNDYTVEGNTLRYWRAQADKCFTGAQKSILQTELNYNSYVYKQSEESVLNNIRTIEREMAVNKTVYDRILAERKAVMDAYDKIGSSSSTIYPQINLPYEAEVKEYEQTIANQEKQLEIYYRSICYEKDATSGEWKKLTGSALTAEQNRLSQLKASFEAQLKEIYDRLETASEQVRTINRAVYHKEARLQNTTTGIVVIGGTSTIMYTAVAAVVALLLSWIVAYAIEWVKNNKAQLQQSAAQTEKQPAKEEKEEPKE